ncbi:putative serine/threonine-protein kinase iks1 [Conoideocrella luteorostrata]|uniref:non-specific serine/threonine protein kinase n=1 Tax=Conoideocrella luteorostrata TaxID=1105319 RepID=A0AAJ0CXA4_9HYPO|nr:putative serine/threonine-protein kinase iks1 [Conoideocrella luteorostrata]
MSLIPYHPREGREIVLRHRNAVVVRDRESQRLEIRGSECPTCHQPLGRAPSPERAYDRSYEMNHEYVNPEYFRMLRTGNHSFPGGNGPPSPVRRLVEPASVVRPQSRATPHPEVISNQEETVFISSNPEIPLNERSRIRREAFSPNYFKTFFVEERVLGKGGKGVVLLVRHEIDGCPLGHFACKRVPVGDDHSWLEKVLIEVELLAKLSHPNLVSYRHVWLEDIRLTRFGPSVACAFILQQYCNSGDLHQHVIGGAPKEVTKEELKAQIRRRSRGHAEMPQDPYSAKPQLSFEEIYSLFKDITSGVAYLHGANYIHRDLKPSNCLLHHEGGKLTCLISDFGEVQPENAVRKSTGSTGTISYCAPEVLKVDISGQFGNFTTKSDVFSLGMILYFMCFGRLPYQGANAIQEELEDIDQLRAEITDWQGFQDERQKRPDLPSKLYTLLKKLLALDPAERPSANEVLLAMRSETNFDNITKGDWVTSAPSTLRGNRIQNLDSPMLPGTPIPDPKKENSRGRPGMRTESAGSNSPPLDGIRSPKDLGIMSQNDTFSNHERHNHVGFEGGSLGNDGDGSNATDDTGTVATESDGQSAPRLLMAPPRTLRRELWHRVTVICHWLIWGFGIDEGVVDFIIRSMIFLFKLTTLARPCWPYVLNLEVGFPLVIIAALELGWPGSVFNLGATQSQIMLDTSHGRKWRGLGIGTRALLLGFHIGALWIARRWEVLCTRESHSEWA